MNQECRRLLDYAHTGFDRVMQRRVMFAGGVLIAIGYLDWIIALIGCVLCYTLDHVEMKACRALLKARDRLSNDADLRRKLRVRLHLAGTASTFAVVLFIVATSLRASEELRFLPLMFFVSAALYWAVSQHQLDDIVRSRSLIVASGVLVVLAVPMVMHPPGVTSLMWPKAITTACVFYFIHICARAYAANYDRSLDQITAAERSLKDVAESDQRKSDLLRVLSHELRTPLNGVLGMTQLLSLGELTSQQRAQLAAITSSGNRLDELLTDVMDSERLNSGSVRIIKEPVDFSSFISPILDRHRRAADAKGLRFEVEAQTALPDRVVIDAARAAQCLDHLISNAVKFTNEGRVKVSCSHMISPGPPRLIFKVRDTGIGMSKDAQSRIFQRFAQEDMSESRIHGGMGLGLWNSKIIAELMGGSLGVNSKPGVGSTFTLNLIAEAVTAKDAGASAQGSGQSADLAS